MRIGILQAGHFPEELVPRSGTYTDLYARMLAGHGFEFETWSVVDGIFPDSVEDADGWLITGSKHGAYDDLPWIPPLEDFIRRIRDSHRPLVGICFGHQIIAQALGGKVVKFPGGWSVGRTEYDFDGKRVVLNAWHQDQVVEKPAGARVVGRSDFCCNAALVYDSGIYTIQPHPEFASAEIEGLIAFRGGVIPEDRRQSALAALNLSVDSSEIADRIAAFFLANGSAETWSAA